MPFDDCIDAALNANEINDNYANHARAIYRDHLATFETSMPRAEAMAEAARSAFGYLEAEAAERRRQAFLSLAARDDIMRRLDTYRDRSGAANPFRAAAGLFDRLLPGRNGFAVEQQRVHWRNQAHARMDRAFAAFRPDWLLRRRNGPLMTRVVRELFGEGTGDALAANLARGWTDAAEFLRSHFNRFGGHIGLLENWGLPQGHDGRAVRNAGREEWISFITPRLDLNRMVDAGTGRPFAESNPVLRDASARRALEGVYDTIITEGWNDREASSAAGRAKANARADHRFLVFKTADDWMAYQQRFGEPDPFNSMMRHIDSLSRDIALMQVLGPSPGATMRWLGQELERRRAIAGLPKDTVTAATEHLGTMYERTTGSLNAPVNERLANAAEDVSNVLTAAQLGGAVLASVPSDINFSIMARRLNGMPEVGMFRSLLQQLNPLDASHREAAVQIGAGAAAFARTLSHSARYVGELGGHRWSRWLADRVLAFSGLSPWTEAARTSFYADALGTAAAHARTRYARLPEAFRDALARYRIGEPEWETLRRTPTHNFGGMNIIRAEDVANRADIDPTLALDLAGRLDDWASSETEFAVPSGSLAGTAHARGKTRRGSVASLVTESVLKYKTFGTTMLMTHGRRMLAQGGYRRRGSYAAALVLSSITAGAIVLQMKEIAAGRNPRDMTDAHFWGAALIQGGGVGIIGDFVYSGLAGASRSGGGLSETVAGPIGGLVGDAFRALFGVAMSPQQEDVAARQSTNLLDFTKRYMPGGSIWYARLALERYVWDSIQEAIDPGWKRRVRSIENWYRRQYHNGFWWKRGDQPGFDSSSVQTPDLSTALGSKAQ